MLYASQKWRFFLLIIGFLLQASDTSHLLFGQSVILTQPPQWDDSSGSHAGPMEVDEPILLAERTVGASSDFFDLDGRMEANDEEPKQQSIQLPPKMEEAPPVPNAELSPEMTGWIRWLVLKNLPPTYEDKKKWGQQKQVVDGLHVEMKGLKIDTHRKYKMVNHGSWTRYFVELQDPEQELQIKIVNLIEPRPGVMRFETIVEAPVHIFGRYSRYQWDVHLVTLSADADARVRMSVIAEVEMVIQPLVLPPVLEFRPKVLDSKVELLEFQITKISQMRGPLAKALGESLERVLRNRLDDYGDKLTQKINTQLEKQKDKLTISTAAWIAGAPKK